MWLWWYTCQSNRTLARIFSQPQKIPAKDFLFNELRPV
jgi:hypothetical protein